MKTAGRLAVVFVVATIFGCGGESDDTQLPIDAVPPRIDAEPPPIDAEPPPIDAPLARGDVLDFDICTDSASCSCAVTNDCNNPASDCVEISVVPGSLKRCLPACTAATQDTACPFSSVCYPSSLGAMANRCYWSLCGEAAEINNGTTGGACQLGAEIGLPSGQQYPGYCLSFEDGQSGLCMEAGTVAAEGVCDLGTQSRGGANCDQSTLCIGSPSALQGICMPVCDPRTIDLSSGAGDNCPAPPLGHTYGCQDVSSHTGTTVGTVGICVQDVTSCSLVAATNTCPLTSTGQKQGCAPTNSVRATGLCDDNWGGDLAFNTTCISTATTDSMQCVFGSDCMDHTGSNRCEQFCDLTSGTPIVTCAAGTCQSFDLAESDPTLNWGSCR